MVVSPDVVIGDNVKIQNNVSVYTGVMLEDDVFCGPSMVFTNVDQSAQPRLAQGRVPADARRSAARRSAPTHHRLRPHDRRATRSSAPARSSRSDVPDYALVVGNPGRVAGWVCECGVKLRSGAALDERDLRCETCGLRYGVESGRIERAAGPAAG